MPTDTALLQRHRIDPFEYLCAQYSKAHLAHNAVRLCAGTAARQRERAGCDN